MLTIPTRNSSRNCAGVNRRDFIRVGTLSMLGMSWADWLAMKGRGEIKAKKARSVIQLWMGGGPTHIDTWDPKPEAGEDYCGPLKNPIETNVSGIRIGQLMPLLAKQADKYAILRSFTHSNDSHETGTYMVQTGTVPVPELAYPCIGSVVALKKGFDAGYQGSLPPYITLTYPMGRFSDEGFLGIKYKSFVTGGDPNAKDFRVGGLAPAHGMSEQRLQDRRALFAAVDARSKDKAKLEQYQAIDTYQEKAYGMILGDSRKAFDLSSEKEELRNRYGRNDFGQSCLLARRLVEYGVPFITINNGGWDTHVNHFQAMQTKLPILDQGFATLLDDLAQRGLLESTIVVWYGEFGRTPRVALEPPWNGGRHHHGRCFSAVVAGGGFKGGAVVGASDARGEDVKDRPVYPWDLSASIYQLLGIDPHGRLPHPQGCVANLTPLGNGTVKSGGLLKEIM